MKEYPQPQTVKEAQSFLGIVSWLQRFIPRCATLTTNIRKCISDSLKKFKLSDHMIKEVEILKEIITSDTCLAHPCLNKRLLRAVGLIEVAGGPQGALRSLEKVFGELVLGVKWVEEGVLRKKLVKESHVETHEGEFHLFWRLLKRGFFWKDMRKDCRAEVRSCVDCLHFNVGARGFMLLRVRSVKLLMVEVYGDHVG